MSAGVVIVGGGQAGYQTAASLRSEGYTEPIAIIGDEAGVPYQRPPLSKALLLGKQAPDRLALRPANWYVDRAVQWIPDTRVHSIDRSTRTVLAESGARFPYDYLVLATGARNRTLNTPGALYLRTLREGVALQERLQQASNVTVIGGGFIGLEVAAAARALGKTVAVYDTGPRVMARAVCPEVSQYFEHTHAAQGVSIHTNFSATPPPADLTLVGIGVIPNTDLAEMSGLAVANGIVTDSYLRTADPSIFAIGDCASYPNPFAAGGMVRLESVQNAVDQALCVARAIVGKPAPYRAVPWFWTEQFDIRMQMAGIGTGADRIVLRGSTSDRKFSAVYFKSGRLIAADSINQPAEHLAFRKLLDAGTPVTPEQAVDLSTDLKSLL